MGIIEVPGYLTPEEARAAGVAWRPRYRVETEGDRLNACSVLLTPAERNVQGRGWLCKVCARAPLKDAERFIPLGRHSIMNGAGIRLATPEGPALTAAFERVITMSSAWELLDRWGDAEFARLAADASADAYSRMPTEQYPDLVNDFPMLGDARWLAGGRRSSEVGRRPQDGPSIGTEGRS